MKKVKKSIYTAAASLMLLSGAQAKLPFNAFKNISKHFTNPYFSPVLGMVALESGLIHNIRFNMVDEKGPLNKEGNITHVLDKGQDPHWNMVKILFPSADGVLGISTEGRGNIAKYATPDFMAALMVFEDKIRDAYLNGGDLDKIYKNEWEKTFFKANKKGNTGLLKDLKIDATERNMLKKNILELFRHIKDAVIAEETGNTVMPKHTTEQIISAFLCAKADTVEDLEDYRKAMNDLDKARHIIASVPALREFEPLETLEETDIPTIIGKLKNLGQAVSDLPPPSSSSGASSEANEPEPTLPLYDIFKHTSSGNAGVENLLNTLLMIDFDLDLTKITFLNSVLNNALSDLDWTDGYLNEKLSPIFIQLADNEHYQKTILNSIKSLYLPNKMTNFNCTRWMALEKLDMRSAQIKEVNINENMLFLKELFLPYGATSMTGYHNLPALEKLVMTDANIREVSIDANMGYLKELSLPSTATSMTGYGNLPALEKLNMFYTQIKEVNIDGEMKSLKELILPIWATSMTGYHNLPVLEKLVFGAAIKEVNFDIEISSLKELNLGSGSTSITGYHNLPALEKLYMSGAQIKEVNFDVEISSLKELYLPNGATSMTGYRNLPALEKLDMADALIKGVVDIDGKMSFLKEIYLPRGTTSMTGYHNLPALEKLYITSPNFTFDSCQLTSLNLISTPYAGTLTIHGNKDEWTFVDNLNLIPNDPTSTQKYIIGDPNKVTWLDE